MGCDIVSSAGRKPARLPILFALAYGAITRLVDEYMEALLTMTNKAFDRVFTKRSTSGGCTPPMPSSSTSSIVGRSSILISEHP